MEQALRHTAYNYLLEKAELLYYLLEQDGTIILANHRALQLSAQTLTGQNFTSILTSPTAGFKPMVAKEEPVLLNVANHGGLPMTYYFIFLPCDEVIAAFGQLDGNEVDRLRREMLDLNNELSNLTRELHKKNAELVILNAQKDRFLGMASHDLRHPIQIINMFNQLLKDDLVGDLSKKHQDFLKHIETSCIQMQTILNDFLDYSRFEEGHFELNLKTADLNILLAKIADYSGLLARQKGRTFLYSPAQTPLPATFDPAKIEQVINNLVSNAIKYTDPDATIRLSGQKDNGSARIYVEDDGPGIAPELHAKLFLPYTRTGQGDQDIDSSTGLGLAIAKMLMEAHAGTISLESLPGRGSIFCITLPISEATKEQ